MAVTKILPRNTELKAAIRYILNESKTDGQALTARLNCKPGYEYEQMMETKKYFSKTGGRQCYHLILSYKPGEITPELALQVATEFAEQYLSDYETVIAVHTDREHIHAHVVFNSVSCITGRKYHVSNGDYYKQIRGVSDRLCRKYGLSVVIEDEEKPRGISYIEWLRQSKGQPTYRSMLEADLRTAIESATCLGDFYMIMEHMGYEIKHGNRLSFRLGGTERFMCPGRKNLLFTEDGILAAIEGSMNAFDAELKPVAVRRPAFTPYRKHPKYTGFMALYVHYLYILDKIEKQEYPPRVTPQMRKDVMRFEQLKEEFRFLREHDISTAEDMAAFENATEETLAGLMKRRTILNVQKRKRKKLYDALADAEMLADVPNLYAGGVSDMNVEDRRYSEAAALLEQSGIDRDMLKSEKTQLYEKLAVINRETRTVRKKLRMCKEIRERAPQMEQDIKKQEPVRWRKRRENSR